MSVSTLVVNFFAGPGTGKTTTTAATFAELKYRGVNVEMALEYPKELVWERSFHLMSNQLRIFAEQHHRIWRVLDQVEAVLVDCPLLASLYYGESQSRTFKKLVLEEHAKLWNFNVFLMRSKPYEQRGRVETESQARQIDTRLQQLLLHHTGVIDKRPCNEFTAKILADDIEMFLRSRRPAVTECLATDSPA